MGFSIADIEKKGIKLDPVEMDVDGFKDKVIVQRFTWAQFDTLLEADKETSDKNYITRQVIRLMSGPGIEPTEEQITQMQNVFSAAQIMQIYTEGFAVNGFGPSASRNAQKK